MKRETLKQRRRRLRREKAIWSCTRIAVCVIAALALVTVGWRIAAPFLGDSYGQAETGNDGQKGPIAEVQAAENEDGSGNAGIAQLAETTEVPYEAPGWQYDNTGWWYAVSDTTYYQNGFAVIDDKTYHFDSSGYLSVGWTPIGGKGYYFDENGVYDPEKDHSMMIALTFDDGPGAHTGELLDTLKQYGAKATFFLQGVNIEQYGGEAIARMASEGHLIGNHSYDHPNMLKLSAEDAATQFQKTDDLIAQYNNGSGASVVRFPYGNKSKELEAIAARPCFMWDVDTMDWESRNVQSNIQAVLNGVEPGQIILMHDTYQATVEACKTIIPELVSRGYELVTLDTLAAASGVELQNGVTYYGFSQADIDAGNVSDAEN